MNLNVADGQKAGVLAGLPLAEQETGVFYVSAGGSPETVSKVGIASQQLIITFTGTGPTVATVVARFVLAAPVDAIT